jgi:hypothetical protein
MEAYSSETMAHFQQSAQRDIPEDRTFHKEIIFEGSMDYTDSEDMKI